jgi:uncharacterized protein YndB with AHSA1/START domain
MASSSVSRVVDAPVERVWEVLAQFGEISRWGTGVDHSTLLTSGPVGPGTTRRVQVGRNALRETITTWEPGSRLAYALVGLPPVVRSATNTWQVEAVPGGTKVTLSSEVQAPPVIVRLVARRMAKVGEQLVDGLHQHLTGARA